MRLERSDLYHYYQRLAQSHWQEIPGVHCLQGPEPGPNLGIMAMTHGNEPAGLAAFAALMAEPERLRKGRVFLIVNNLAAAQRYFAEAQDLSFTAHYRFIDQDMNRVPESLLGDSYELSRIRQLLPLYSQLDAVLDLHSTSAICEPMLIELCPDQPILEIPGVNIMLKGILPLLRGRAVVQLCKQAQGFVLECGSHEAPESLSIAQAALWCILAAYRMTKPETGSNHKENDVECYSVYTAVVFPDSSYALVRVLQPFEFLPAGTILAHGEGPPIMVQQDSWAIMPSPRLKPVHPGSEFFYLATKV